MRAHHQLLLKNPSGGGHVGVVQNTGTLKRMPNGTGDVVFNAADFASGHDLTAGNVVYLGFTVYDPSNDYFSSPSAGCAVSFNGTSAGGPLTTAHHDSFTVAIYRGVAGSGSGGIRINFSVGLPGGAYIAAGAIEVDDDNGLDITATSTTGTSTAPSITTGSLASSNERVFSVVGMGENQTTVITFSGDTQVFLDTDGSNECPGGAGYRDASGAGAQTVTWVAAPITGWSMIAAVFKKL